MASVDRFTPTWSREGGGGWGADGYIDGKGTDVEAGRDSGWVDG